MQVSGAGSHAHSARELQSQGQHPTQAVNNAAKQNQQLKAAEDKDASTVAKNTSARADKAQGQSRQSLKASEKGTEAQFFNSKGQVNTAQAKNTVDILA